MKALVRIVACVVSICSAPAWAGLITTTTPGDPMGGYDMTTVPVTASVNDMVSIIPLSGSLSGQIEFHSQGPGPLLELKVATPSWWQHGTDPVYTTNVYWVEIILPANTQAFSFYVGTKWANAGGWWQAFDGDGNHTEKLGFSVSNDNTPGFGVWNTDSYGTISRIIVEPYNWGVGDFSISQGNYTSVPEPGTMSLLGIGLLGMGLIRRVRRTAAGARIG